MTNLVRDPDNIDIWSDCEVFFAKTLSPVYPATIDDPIGSTWGNLGVLSGDAGVKNPREWEKTKHNGWGVGQYRIGFKNYAESLSVTGLERNQTSQMIGNPGSTATSLVVPTPAKRHLLLQRVNDNGELERKWTRKPCQITPPGQDFNESDPASMEYMCDVFADGLKRIWVRQYTPVNEAQVLTVTGGAGAGDKFTIDTINWGVTGDIAYSANAAAIQAALVALLGAGNVTVTGTTPFPITLTGELAGFRNPLFVATGQGVTVASIAPAP